MKGKYKNRKTGEIINVYKVEKGWYYYIKADKNRGMATKKHIKNNYSRIK